MERVKIEVNNPLSQIRTEDERFCSCLFFAYSGRYKMRRGMTPYRYCKNLVYRNKEVPPMICSYTEKYLNSLYNRTLLRFAVNRKLRLSPETRKALIQDIIRYFKKVEEYYMKKGKSEKEEEGSEEVEEEGSEEAEEGESEEAEEKE
jgi:hypothetical protein